MASIEAADLDASAQRRALSVAALGTLLTLIAFTAPLATLGATSVDLGSDTAGTTWILASMSIGLSAALLPSGTISDDYGRRRTFVIGLGVLAVGSLVCAIAPNTLIFVSARVIQGLGGAAVVASSLGIIAHAFPPGPARASASGVWGAGVGAGIALGPLTSAYAARVTDWRGAYWILVVAAVALGVAARLSVRESRSDTPRGVDVLGSLLLAAGISALLATLVEGRQGWTQIDVIVLGVAAVVLLAAFVLVEYRSRTAMLDLSLFRRPPFVAATVAATATGAGIIALMSYMSVFVVGVLGVSTLGAAYLLLLWSGSSVVTALLARRIPPRVSGRAQLAIGLIGVAVGQLALLGASADSTAVHFAPGLLIAGVASGVLNAALGREAVASVPPGRGGLGSGANNTARYVGSAVGVSIVAAIAAHPGAASQAARGWNHAALVTAIISVVGAAVVFAADYRTRSSTSIPSTSERTT